VSETPLSADVDAWKTAKAGYEIQLPIKKILALSKTAFSAFPKRKDNTALWKIIMSPPIKIAKKVVAAIAPAAERETIFSSPFPLYCATITVPPVATAIKTLSRNIFMESTIFTALTASTPAELIIAVLKKFMNTINAWSTKIGIIIAITL